MPGGSAPPVIANVTVPMPPEDPNWIFGYGVPVTPESIAGEVTASEPMVSSPADVVAMPAQFVNTARNRFPLWLGVPETFSVGDVAPGIFEKVEPPSMLTCH